MFAKFPSATKRTQFLLIATVAALTACGGGDADRAAEPAVTAAAAEAQTEQPARRAMLAVAAADSTASYTLTLRASADLAGGVGPMVQVRVDGVTVGSVEVGNTEPTDYRLTVPQLEAGSRLDIVYTNDAVIGAENRNLRIHQITSANTFVFPSADFVSFDKGAGAAAFDGKDVAAGSSYVGINGALRMTWPSPNLTNLLTVRASATGAGGTGAQMLVRADGVVVGAIEVSSISPQSFVFAAPPLEKGKRVDVAFTNAGTVSGIARSLRVHYLMSGTTVMQPTAGGMSFDAGSGLAAFDGLTIATTSENLLTANGALRGWWPSPNMTDSLTLRANARAATDIGRIVQVQVDGIVVGTVELGSTVPSDVTFPTLPMKPGQRVAVVNTNNAPIGNEDRDVRLAYVMSGKTVLKASDNAINAIWPEPNLTDTLLVRARGVQAGGIAPIMQVLVDDILVGTAEVASSEHADYQFAVPSMNEGRKLDVVYTNDGSVGSENRNLFIAYATTRNTVWKPSANGNTYDRGKSAAAFDGADLVAPSGNMYWSGALRATWPAANITSSVTVRASAVSAGGTGALMTLWVDGVAVSATSVTTTTPSDFLMPTTALKTGSKIALTFGNPGTVDGVARSLNIAYAIAGTTLVTPSLPGVSYSAGYLSASWPSPNLTDTVTVRAYADVAGGAGALIQLRVNGVIVGSREVGPNIADHAFSVPPLKVSDRVDVVYVNDATINGVSRNLYLQYVQTAFGTMAPYAPNVVTDLGNGEAAFDGLAASNGGTGVLYGNGAIRFNITGSPALPTSAQHAASRFLQQATFGPTLSEIERVASIGAPAWIDEQIALPFTPDMVAAVQSKYDLGNAYRFGGARYSPFWVTQQFWNSSANQKDQLRRRVGYALHQILMVSMDSPAVDQIRGYAHYVDTLNKSAFGNYRTLLEEIALHPMMGMYLSHMRNRAEDDTTGRMPDENFARELMQLFTIGLQELNADGTPKLNSSGQPIETYTNNDVMALAKAFTGFSWAFDDGYLTEAWFLRGKPELTLPGDKKIDLLPMKAYPGQHSLKEKRLFAGKPWAVTLPAGNSAVADVRMALDAVFNHPNVGPFVGRQLIQHLVASHPSPAYVARVAAVFNNNGKGQRGDLAAVVKAVLMDTEASNPPAGSIGRLREPVLRVTHWMRAFDAKSASGQYPILYDLDPLAQRPLFAPSVFGYYRPGYVPPNTALSKDGITAPVMQIVNESTTAHWVNLAQRMAGTGLAWNGSGYDVAADLSPLTAMVAAGQLNAVIDRLDLLLYGGRMSAALRQDLLEVMTGVVSTDTGSYANRARAAMMLALASPEYLVQR